MVLFETAAAFLMRDAAKRFGYGIFTLIRILQDYNSLESPQYGGVTPTKNPMMHSDVHAHTKNAGPP